MRHEIEFVIADMYGSFADMYGSFADMYGSLADIYGSFADTHIPVQLVQHATRYGTFAHVHGSFVDIGGSFAHTWGSSANTWGSFANISETLLRGHTGKARGGGLGSRPKKMYGERLGDGVEYHLMSPTPRCQVPFTTGRRAH